MAQKKNRKKVFYLWVKFNKLSYSFSAAKEKVYSPVILNRRDIQPEKRKVFPVNVYFLEID